MNAEQHQEISHIYHLLIHTETLSKDATLTGVFEAGEKRGITQFNAVLTWLIESNAIPDGIFDPLDDGASFGEIGVACSQLAAYLSGKFADLIKPVQQTQMEETQISKKDLEMLENRLRLVISQQIESKTPHSGPRKFSDQFKKAMQYAREEAGRLQQDYIATEHVLLGIIRDRTNAVRILRILDVDIDALRQTIEDAVTPSEQGARPAGQVPFTPRAKQSLEIAAQEAADLNAKTADTEHLLLALARDKQGIAAQVLESLGATYNRVRAEVEQT